MNELQAALKVVCANAFAMYFKAQTHHWNVEGLHFSEFHGFFSDIYSEVYGSIDPIAEQIRAVDGFAPFSLVDLMSASTVKENTMVLPTVRMMVADLMSANQQVTASLNTAFTMAQSQTNQGLMNFIADRLDRHAKHAWQLKSTLKNIGDQ